MDLSPFDRMLGLELTLCTPDRVTARLELRDEHKQPHGLAHGGLYAALAETAASEGTNAGVSAEGMAGFGASNNTSFLRSISAGVIHVSAEPRHRGRSLWVWDVECSDDDGRACALSRVTVAVRRPRS